MKSIFVIWIITEIKCISFLPVWQIPERKHLRKEVFIFAHCPLLWAHTGPSFIFVRLTVSQQPEQASVLVRQVFFILLERGASLAEMAPSERDTWVCPAQYSLGPVTLCLWLTVTQNKYWMNFYIGGGNKKNWNLR